MDRYRQITLPLFCLIFTASFSQYKYEREHRIKKNQFPVTAHTFIENNVDGARNLKYYRETDSTSVNYAAKFKIDRLKYSASFDRNGKLIAIDFLIKEVEIPNESFALIEKWLESNFSKYHIRRIHQRYPIRKEEAVGTTLNNAFQNLLLPNLQYEMMIRGRKENSNDDYEVLFDADGQFIEIRTSLPANYDHIRY